MSHQFKPGDPALTLVSKYGLPSMCQVELVIFMRGGWEAMQLDGEIWTAPYDGWVVGREDLKGYGFFKPEELMPLRGDFAPEQQKARETAL
ncbi:hypothetical protein [Pseudomonas sp. MWU12-2345]|uniref:hypothetical protein n=1 Tax=Pseudomonas sp. MWU12-2345 TaxID=2928689 RepID=UPI00200D51CC|nr:hypothetical protein [Pseudomonas sp. MWU12-2345]